MVFSSMVFLCVFLPAAFCLHLLLPGMRAKNFLLVMASLVFYAYGEPIYVILLVASSAGNYILARLTGECPKIRKLTMTLAVVINLGLLVIFKYSGFLVETFNSVTGAGIPVPPGPDADRNIVFYFSGTFLRDRCLSGRCFGSEEFRKGASVYLIFPTADRGTYRQVS